MLLILYLFIASSLPLMGPWAPEPVGQSDEAQDCKECHDDLVNRDVMHYPAEDACDNCHESTGASHPFGDSLGFRLMDQVPALCFNCHEESASPIHAHLPVVQGKCLDCHDAHGSTQTSLLLTQEQELCLGCHNRAYSGDSSETANISRLVKGSKRVVHTAISELGCLVCHQAHGSDKHDLLVDTYPAEDYLPATTENFALCFLCHDTDILDAEESEWATAFRNGKQNLHRLHINGSKGRNCRMCHNIHGSTLEFLMEEEVSFGSWEMRLNFVPTEQGGSCLPGCHGKLSYERSY